MEYAAIMATCPMGLAFPREEVAARAEGRGMDLTELWRQAGRPRGRSPRQRIGWMIEDGRIRDEGGGPDGRLLADPGTALLYVSCWLDRTGILARVGSAIFMGALRADPAPMLTKANAGLIALTAKLDLIAGGMTDAEAGRHLMDRVDRHVAARGLDPWAEETAVMHAQRAVADLDATGLVCEGEGRPLS